MAQINLKGIFKMRNEYEQYEWTPKGIIIAVVAVIAIIALIAVPQMLKTDVERYYDTVDGIETVDSRYKEEILMCAEEALNKAGIQIDCKELSVGWLDGCPFVNVHVLTFEKFYFRNGSYASLTVVLTENNDEKTADIIGSGGGEGLFNISWGANSSFARDAENILRDYGLSII